MFQNSSLSWQIPSKRKLHKVGDKQHSVSIVTYNRFADLDDDDSGDSGKIAMEEKNTKKFKVNKEIINKHEEKSRREIKHRKCKPGVEKKEVKVTNIKNPSVKVLVKKHENSLKMFERENRYSALQALTEDDIEIIVIGENAKVDNKRKCKYCNFKRRCHLNRGLCKARESICL